MPLSSFLSQYYFELKALHIIAVIAWFAGLFYIFRLFVYHAHHRGNLEICKVFVTMESKLLRIIMIPASVVVLFSGTALAIALPGTFESTWFYAKLFSVLLLFAYQSLSFVTHRRFSKGDIFLTEKQCRFVNEVPTILLIGIVTLVVLKPWL
jgi:protoporphyrinogen IX oxidase